MIGKNSMYFGELENTSYFVSFFTLDPNRQTLYTSFMYTIVGLGNPGGEYRNTRHNAGRIIATIIAEDEGIELKEKKKPDYLVGNGTVLGTKARIILPNTFMNKSGSAVSPSIKSVAAAKKLVVIHDEIDLPFGSVRVAFGSSTAGHNGVASVARAVKTKNFIRVRIGVAKVSRGKAKKPTGGDAVVKYLLGNFTSKELDLLKNEITDRVIEGLEEIVETGDPTMGMNAVNGLPLIK